jgi:hypothetical protein
MDAYKYEFNPSDCDKSYFDELMNFLNRIDFEKEEFTRMIPKPDIPCTYPALQGCSRDEFFYGKEPSHQIILGRFFDTIGCFYECDQNYFAMAMNPYSLFKNDVFIRYMIDNSDHFTQKLLANDSKIEDIFPVRIVLSTEHEIPTHALTSLSSLIEYDSQLFPNGDVDAVAISKDNQLRLQNTTGMLQTHITEKFPINHVVSRELCILRYMDLHFYVVNRGDAMLPFVLVSKYSEDEIESKLGKLPIGLEELPYHKDTTSGGSRRTTNSARNKATAILIVFLSILGSAVC